MSSPPSDPAVAAALHGVTQELAALRQSVHDLATRLGALTEANATLHARLEQSERARADLATQTERILELLAEAKRELRTLQPRADGG